MKTELTKHIEYLLFKHTNILGTYGCKEVIKELSLNFVTRTGVTKLKTCHTCDSLYHQCDTFF